MSATTARASGPRPSGAFYRERVTAVRHWTDRLFSFRTTRDPAFRFRAGEFAMIGLEVEGKPLLRAYSMGSAPWDEGLEFLSIKVPDGPLTSRLAHVREGDEVLVGRKPVGTLVLDSLLPGRTLWMFATGTGLAPFLALAREPEVYDRFERAVVVHTVRQVDELAYRGMLSGGLAEDEALGELVRGKLLYYPSVTREDFPVRERIPALVESGRLVRDLGLDGFGPGNGDRAMICGSAEMLRDCAAMLEARGFEEGSHSSPGHYVVEKAFVEK